MTHRATTFLVFLAVVLAAGAATAQIHCSQLPPITVEGNYPRCSSRELAVAGFPDHMHAYTWHGWEVLTDSAGQTYGPGAMCDHKELLPSEGLVIEPDRKYYRQFELRHNPGYGDCDMVHFLELMDWANHEVSHLLGISAVDTLTMLNTDNVPQYDELTGQGVWRLYQLEGDKAVLQPIGVLMARTLVAHAAFMLAADWILQEAVPADLPPWLHQGIVEYMGEDGTHLLNYMAEFRPKGDVLLSPPLIDALLAKGVDPDQGTDREMFRRSCYSAFLMVWQLVENEGGLTALREFLDLAAGGMDLDQACTKVYGMDLGGLAAYLDPVKIGEPIPKNMDRQVPHAQP
ncbi:MAG: hypothetical protein ABFS42_15810 [Candidatus Krumholzibacteriota bacterium]